MLSQKIQITFSQTTFKSQLFFMYALIFFIYNTQFDFFLLTKIKKIKTFVVNKSPFVHKKSKVTLVQKSSINTFEFRVLFLNNKVALQNLLHIFWRYHLFLLEVPSKYGISFSYKKE